VQEEAVLLETLDGVHIDAVDIRSDAHTPVATVVIGHPHPLYGGDRTNHVVRALQQAAWENDCHSIAVNFRGVGMSGGEHDNGDAERLDLAAACELAEMIEPEANIVMSGYSFGAVVALNVTHPLITAWIGIAPPVSMMGSQPTARTHHRPKFLFVPEHDQFCSPDQLREHTLEWTHTSITVVNGVDHFFAAEALNTARRAVAMALTAQ
jgi:alpha/beta superfamily hydrolase